MRSPQKKDGGCRDIGICKEAQNLNVVSSGSFAETQHTLQTAELVVIDVCLFVLHSAVFEQLVLAKLMEFRVKTQVHKSLATGSILPHPKSNKMHIKQRKIYITYRALQARIWNCAKLRRPHQNDVI